MDSESLAQLICGIAIFANSPGVDISLEPTMTDLDAFLRWNSGSLLENRTRGAYAEWLVHRALDLDPGQHRVEWAEVDETFGSISLEVNSAAFVQSWQQARPRTISFPIEQRMATAYAFCLLGEESPKGL